MRTPEHPLTPAQAQDRRLIEPMVDSIYWEVFFRLDGMDEVDGAEAGMIATKAANLARRELTRLIG